MVIVPLRVQPVFVMIVQTPEELPPEFMILSLYVCPMPGIPEVATRAETQGKLCI